MVKEWLILQDFGKLKKQKQKQKQQQKTAKTENLGRLHL